MASLFRRRQKRVDLPRLKPRHDPDQNVSRVELAELTPDLFAYLGQAAYVQLAIFETLSRAVSTAPTMSSKEAVSRAAALSLARHHAITAEIAKKGKPVAETMAPFADRIDEYSRAVAGADWYETLVASYLTSGLLDDFFHRLAGGLPGDSAARVAAIYSSDNGHLLLVQELRAAIGANPKLASRLAMWGRRLVGDTLLIARSVLAPSAQPTEERLEPVFTEIIAAHTRRMDGLGLTA